MSIAQRLDSNLERRDFYMCAMRIKIRTVRISRSNDLDQAGAHAAIDPCFCGAEKSNQFLSLNISCDLDVPRRRQAVLRTFSLQMLTRPALLTMITSYYAPNRIKAVCLLGSTAEGLVLLHECPRTVSLVLIRVVQVFLKATSMRLAFVLVGKLERKLA